MRDVEKRDQILKSGWERMQNSPTQEHAAAMIEVAKIANHRFDDLVADASPILLRQGGDPRGDPGGPAVPQPPAASGRASPHPGCSRFNELSEAEARAELESCLDVPRWVDVMLEGRPYASVPSAMHRARLAATSFTDDELEAALAPASADRRARRRRITTPSSRNGNRRPSTAAIPQ